METAHGCSGEKGEETRTNIKELMWPSGPSLGCQDFHCLNRNKILIVHSNSCNGSSLFLLTQWLDLGSWAGTWINEKLRRPTWFQGAAPLPSWYLVRAKQRESLSREHTRWNTESLHPFSRLWSTLYRANSSQTSSQHFSKVQTLQSSDPSASAVCTSRYTHISPAPLLMILARFLP